MKQLQKSDLKEGEIYKQLEFDYIFLYNKNETYNSFNDGTAISTYAPRYCKRWSGNDFKKPMVEATSEEKHWLETCIKADKFVSYEEAMKTLIPEYVECIKALAGITIGKILSVENNMVIDGTFNNYSIKSNDIYNYFKPSTKEAYDAQFKDNFALPEQWCVKVTSDNNDFINSVRDRSCTPNTYVTSKLIIPNIKNSWLCKMEAPYEGFTEITLEQFKKYVLKKHLGEPKDKILKFKDFKLPEIEKVQCSEGGVYKIGDKITVFDKTSPNKGKSFTIKSFKWTNDKSKICAVTELHTPNGIGLDKIELYVEPKVKFVLPEKWCIRLNLENVDIVGKWFNENSQTRIDDYHKLTLYRVSTVYNILHYPAYKYLGLTQHGDTINKIKNSYTEITFEQFKKYVLNEKV